MVARLAVAKRGELEPLLLLAGIQLGIKRFRLARGAVDEEVATAAHAEIGQCLDVVGVGRRSGFAGSVEEVEFATEGHEGAVNHGVGEDCPDDEVIDAVKIEVDVGRRGNPAKFVNRSLSANDEIGIGVVQFRRPIGNVEEHVQGATGVGR